ncbi:ribosome-associated protein [[Clostridium] sordellii]|uniref:Ribosome-associated protein n=1 Tax=Paraclostridium sordellii TaxID=1505 RepID=A0A0A1SE60_PARSO|nr:MULTISPECIES: YhbY family RNA-binding protein [Paeniclostridium]MDU5019555.1 YhbY family RNA-binding protein [Clostridiales bacterium]AUN13270.1 RNA-binding protein [Paeniclostridium sordellii]EPZ58397.1 CRS1 / YhbY domain protein [[Clostridium] sordellii VPI 9048] [Paeniclostridium sordellii VPI 9048]MBS6023224.1 YhbY family RNA-binding protein [Paeniclostridium sordellii]MBW4864228.1 YhbY family RNA-binding protein [Paeniclostridium sp.]
MLKGKQRAYLRSIANTLKPITQIGKEGVTESFLDQLEDMLKAREIVKVSILENAGLDAKETANAICEALRAEFVQAIGFKFTIYKKNEENPKIIFPGHEQAKAKKAVATNVTKKGKPTKRSAR